MKKLWSIAILLSVVFAQLPQPTLVGQDDLQVPTLSINNFVNQMLLIESKVNNEIINIGAGEEYKINQFAKLICNIVKFDHEKIIYNKDKFVGAKSKKLNIERKKELLPNYKNIPLEEGLRETILDLEKKLLNDWLYKKNIKFGRLTTL